jgi:beta-galactosidase GanA
MSKNEDTDSDNGSDQSCLFTLVSEKKDKKQDKTIVSVSKTGCSAYELVEKKFKTKGKNYVGFFYEKKQLYLFGEEHVLLNYLETKINSHRNIFKDNKITRENYKENEDFMKLYTESTPQKRSKEYAEDLLRRAKDIVKICAEEKRSALKASTEERGRVIKSPK